MNSFEKGLLAIAAVILALFLMVFVLNAYDGHLRAQVLKNAEDPLYAACAYDSAKDRVPSSCFALLTQNKELPQ